MTRDAANTGGLDVLRRQHRQDALGLERRRGVDLEHLGVGVR